MEDGVRLPSDACRALQHGDTKVLRLAAHALKITSATFNTIVLSTAARKIKYLAHQGKLESTAGLIEHTWKEYAKVKNIIERF